MLANNAYMYIFKPLAWANICVAQRCMSWPFHDLLVIDLKHCRSVWWWDDNDYLNISMGYLFLDVRTAFFLFFFLHGQVLASSAIWCAAAIARNLYDVRRVLPAPQMCSCIVSSCLRLCAVSLSLCLALGCTHPARTEHASLADTAAAAARLLWMMFVCLLTYFHSWSMMALPPPFAALRGGWWRFWMAAAATEGV